MTGYLLAAALVVVMAVGAGAYYQGTQDGRNACEAESARDTRVAEIATAAAADAAASAISKIKVRSTTIRQEVEREIRTRVEYATCVHSPQQLQRINSALTEPGARSSGGGELPGTDPAVR